MTGLRLQKACLTLCASLVLVGCGGPSASGSSSNASPKVPAPASASAAPAASASGEPSVNARGASSASASAAASTKAPSQAAAVKPSDQFITGNPYLASPGQAPVNVKGAWCAVSGGFAQMYVARDYNMFNKYGLNVSTRLISGVQTFMSALQAGEIDFLYCASTGTVPSLASGIQATIVAAPLVGLPYVMVARKGINSVQDLKGKKLGISAQGDLDDRLFRAALKQANVPIDSVQLQPAGSQTDRYKSVLSGLIDAINVTPPLEIQAQKDGLNIVYRYKELSIPNFSPILVNDKVLKSQPETVQRFVATMAESLWYMDGHKQEVEKSLGKQLKITDPAALDSAYQAYAQDYVNPNVQIPVDAVQDAIDTARAQGNTIKQSDPTKMIDQRFAQDLQTSGFLQKMWGRPIPAGPR